MHQKVIACVSICFLLTAASLTGDEVMKADNEPVQSMKTVETLRQFWADSYNVPMAQSSSSLFKELLAKAAPDECYYGIGDERNDFSPGLDPDSCRAEGGVLKVNQAYVWGLTKSGDDIWFGTAPNYNCLVSGSILGSLDPYETEYQVCEFGASLFSPPMPEGLVIGDRPEYLLMT